MGFYVHIHVCFACDHNDGVAEIAKRHLPLLQDDAPRECASFLSALSERTGSNEGTKGGLSLWGMVGNYTRPLEFAKALLPFWEELLKSRVKGGPCSFEHILIIYHEEQSECSGAIEVFLAEGSPYQNAYLNSSVTVKHHERLPFTFN